MVRRHRQGLKQPSAYQARGEDSIVIDCTDPLPVASFWSQALGLELHGPNDDDDVWLEPAGGGPDILSDQVPEVKSVKDRIHLDLRPGDQAAERSAIPKRVGVESSELLSGNGRGGCGDIFRLEGLRTRLGARVPPWESNRG